MNDWLKLFIAFLMERVLTANTYKYAYAKTFQRNHKLDKVSTEEIRLFFLSDSKRTNPLRLCLSKFIYPDDFESESSWNTRTTLSTRLSSIVPLPFDLSWFTAGLNSLTTGFVIVPRPNFTTSISTSVFSSVFDPLSLLNPYMSASLISGGIPRLWVSGRRGEFCIILRSTTFNAKPLKQQIHVKITIVLFWQKSNSYLPFK